MILHALIFLALIFLTIVAFAIAAVAGIILNIVRALRGEPRPCPSAPTGTPAAPATVRPTPSTSPLSRRPRTDTPGR